MQPGLFALPDGPTFEDVQAGVRYTPGFLDAARSAALFDALRDVVAWKASRRPMYDRIVDAASDRLLLSGCG